MKRKLVLLAVLGVTLACNESMRRLPGPDDAVALVPWFANMREHVAIRPYKMPLQPVEGTVPITGIEIIPQANPNNRAQLNQLRNSVQRTAASIERGQDRYEIYCVPCHGMEGRGDGPVMPAFARDLTLPVQVQNSDGWIYSWISLGFGIMPEYGSKLSREDRWHIVNYVRLLQGVAR